MHDTKVLFLLRLRQGYGYSYSTLNSGLYNSAKFVVSMLESAGVNVKLVQVTDSNQIDREVHNYRPSHVFIEALWVTPNKFDQLIRLHPSVKWTVRVHSESPFLSQEGIATEWIREYLNRRITVAFNSERVTKVFEDLFCGRIAYLPNYFPVSQVRHRYIEDQDHIDIGCFGAIRILKNQYNQALAALEFGKHLGKPVHFHINKSFHGCSTGDSVLRSIRSLFSHPNVLVEHPWLPEDKFKHLIRKMDVGMQVSFSESFNIVAAQFADAGIPLVVSPEISWASSWAAADPTDVDGIAHKLRTVTGFLRSVISRSSLEGLSEFSHKSKHIWLGFLRN